MTILNITSFSFFSISFAADYGVLVCADDNNVVSTSDVKDKDKLKEIIDKVKENVDKNKKTVEDNEEIIKSSMFLKFEISTISRFSAVTMTKVLITLYSLTYLFIQN